MTRTRQSSRNETGIALMVVLVFVVVLTVLVTTFAYEAQVDATAVAFGDHGFAAVMAGKSAIATGLSILEADLLNNESVVEDRSSGEIFDSLEDIWAYPPEPGELNEAVAQLTITDEFGKINLNALLFENNGEEEVFDPLEMALRGLFLELGLLEDPVDAILDWLDSDDEPRPQGYENDYYQSLENPYSAKNGPMDSIEELLLIPGITLDEYFGTGEEEGMSSIPLPELLTVHGHPEGKVNVNTADTLVVAVLRMVVQTPATPDEQAGRLVAEQVANRLEEDGPFLDSEALKRANLIVEPDPNALPTQKPPAILFTTRSSVFRIRGDGMSGGAQARVEAYVWRSTDDHVNQDGEPASMFRILEWRVIQ